MQILIPRATNKKHIQKDIIKNTIDMLKWNNKNVQLTQKKTRKGK